MWMDGDRGETDTTEERVIFYSQGFHAESLKCFDVRKLKVVFDKETLKTEMIEFIKFRTELNFLQRIT